MNQGFVVVLIVGVAILASIASRRKSYSLNQRIVLSVVAVALLVWTLFDPERGSAIGAGQVVMIIVATVLLVSAVLYLRKSK